MTRNAEVEWSYAMVVGYIVGALGMIIIAVMMKVSGRWTTRKPDPRTTARELLDLLMQPGSDNEQLYYARLSELVDDGVFGNKITPAHIEAARADTECGKGLVVLLWEIAML